MRQFANSLLVALLVPILMTGCGTNSSVRWQNKIPQRNAGNLPAGVPIGLAVLNTNANISVKTGPGKAAGAGVGAIDAMSVVGSAISPHPNEITPYAFLIVVPIFIGTAIGGAIYGGIKSPSKKTQVQAAQRTIESIQRANIPDRLLASIRAQTTASLGDNLHRMDVAHIAPADLNRFYLERNLTNVLEIDSLKIGLTEDGAEDGQARLFFEARSALRNVATGEIIHEMWWRYLGDSRSYAYGGSLLFDQADKLVGRLAEDLSEEIFHKALPEATGPFYGIAPISPMPKTTSAEYFFQQGTYAKADSLQPTLKWAPYAPAPALGEISNVTYELKIWNDDRGPGGAWVIYHEQNLTNHQHRVLQTLSPDQMYRWSVRAHFTRNGRPNVSSWGQRRPVLKSRAAHNEGDRWVGSIRPALLYTFKTPKN